MTDDQRQIILGALLGNGYICRGRKNDYFCMRHSERHLPWLQNKAEDLAEYAAGHAWYIYKTTCTWRAKCDPIFNDFRKLCYPDGVKQVSMEWLDQLRSIGLAVWYGDSGCLTGRSNKNACLRTQSFGAEGNQIIERYFNEVGIECRVNKSRKSQVIVFSVDGTRKLISTIGADLPANRYFKLSIPDK